MVTVKSVVKGSPAEHCGILPGDTIKAINGKEINDVLDYRFQTVNRVLTVVFRHGNGSTDITSTVKKSEYADFGAEFETFLIDKKRHCKNKCIFCFIDQNPQGMRESIYFKDDDERLSFLHGSYITLTNTTESDISRIIEMHISPINISVHTTNPSLRVMMLGNKNAGTSLSYLNTLSAHGIAINAQLVLCHNINDGDELRRTITDLLKLESLQSIAVVPCGLTKYRDNLYPIEPFDKESARSVIEIIEGYGETGRVFASDEFYLTAMLPLPKDEYYADYPQLENGVGMLTSHREEFAFALDESDGSNIARDVTIATGEASYEHIKALCDMMREKFPNINVNVVCVYNTFYGRTVTVSGLLTGQDIENALKDTDIGEALLLPCNMLRSERDLFLDGMSVAELEKKLDTKIIITEKDGADLFEKITNV